MDQNTAADKAVHDFIDQATAWRRRWHEAIGLAKGAGSNAGARVRPLTDAEQALLLIDATLSGLGESYDVFGMKRR